MSKLTMVVFIAGSLAACASKAMTPALHSEITAKIASTQEPMQKCYARLLTTQRKLRGMVVAQAAIQPDGQFAEVSLRRDEPQDPVLRFCIVQAIAALKLDKPPGERIVLDSLPIKFEWSNP